MLPYLHAAGPINYSRTGHLYLQTMVTLESNISPQDLVCFIECVADTNEQYEYYRRNNTGQRNFRFSASTIDQRNEGPFTVVESIETFAGVSVLSCEQHVELWRTWQQRCVAHTERFTDWLRIYNPFGRSGEHLLSISSGLIADDSINCDSAHEVDIAAIDRMTRNNRTYADLQLKHKDKRKATPTDEIPSHSTVVIDGGDLLNRVIWPNVYTYKEAKAGHHAPQAAADADSLVIQTAIEEAKNGENVVAVEEDTDRLVLMIDLVPPSLNVYFMIHGTKLPSRKEFGSRVLQTNFGDIKNYVLFARAVSGCDTSSALYRVGKVKSFKKIEDSNIHKLVDLINATGISQDEVAAAGEAFMVCLYGGNKHDSLNRTHLKLYLRIIGCQFANQLCDPSVLPPTTAAAKEHSLRVYLQMQLWRGVPLSPSEWGCKIVNGEHTPVLTLQVAATEIIMKQIICNCISDCERSCSCQRAGPKYSPMFGHCEGNGCANATEVVDDNG
ncbi:hypothetical protein PR048_003845 [Dryococelus australis]|uniref:Helitron helicase-like domain-containing protein n=1 Tax=Dryococelus australis TaxID=614101 RepID=A0ABQ9IPB7_9NEOP|nr:hypothetical protein PR048_003845 [Dryococelus australis]